MAFSGGTYTLPAGNPVVTATTISSSWANTTLSDIATALSTCMLKDGTQTMTANLPMASFKITGLGAGTAATDAVRLSQLQNNTVSYVTGTAGTNTITASASPTLTALTAGQVFRFIPANTNTAATTLQIDSTAATNIFWNNVALTGGEIRQNVPVEVFYDGTQYQLIGSAAMANTFAMPDTMRVQAAGDRTKQLAVSLTGISTATTRTLTMPDSNVNLAGLTGTQTAGTVFAGPISGAAALPSFRTPSGVDGASLVLIQSQTASNVATVDFTTGINSTYDHYILDCTKVIPGTNNTALWVRASISGGSSYLSTNEYSYGRTVIDGAGTVTGSGGSAVAQFEIKSALGTGTGQQLECSIHFQNLADTAVYKGSYVTGVAYDSGPAHASFYGACSIFTTAAVNAIRLMQGAGNINGVFTLYGVRKS